jgi:AraC-like DNA-binding protein
MLSSMVQSFTDPEAYAGVIPSTQVQNTIVAPGQFEAKVTLIDLHDIRMQRFSVNLPRVAHAVTTSGKVVVASFRTAPGPSLAWGGLEMTPETILRHSDPIDTFHRSSGDAAWGSVSVPATVMANIGSVMAGHDLAAPHNPVSVMPPRAAMWRLQRIHEELGQMATFAPELLAHAGAAKGIEQALLEALVSCLTALESRRERSARRGQDALMRKFHEFLEGNPDEPIYTSELSAALGVPERTMHNCFQEHLGMGPKRYLTLRRMYLARRALEKADPAVTTVTDVATEFGFWEFGRFAVAYKSAFGESPSTTLRQNYEPLPVSRDHESGVALRPHSVVKAA